MQYVYQENAGLSSALNTGLRQSRGKFLVFLDADDRLLPDAVETGVSRMHEHPECAFVSGHCRVIDSEGAILPSPRQHHVEREHYLKLLRGGSYIWCPATVLYQRHVFDFVHGFDVALSPVADYDLYLRITRDFPVHSHNHIIAEHRQHPFNMSRDVSAMERAALAAHGAQWDFVKANNRYREAYDAGGDDFGKMIILFNKWLAEFARSCASSSRSRQYLPSRPAGTASFSAWTAGKPGIFLIRSKIVRGNYSRRERKARWPHRPGLKRE
ncbi:MAG TPA: hypothetical protein DHU55_07665 [Blastocatellia bacterium]|nr:hypothetical protein [Blastocatellia bacterium]HCX29636.1 hypothetical protein [Blastocatellia bacterium]